MDAARREVSSPPPAGLRQFVTQEWGRGVRRWRRWKKLRARKQLAPVARNCRARIHSKEIMVARGVSFGLSIASQPGTPAERFRRRSRKDFRQRFSRVGGEYTQPTIRVRSCRKHLREDLS